MAEPACKDCKFFYKPPLTSNGGECMDPTKLIFPRRLSGSEVDRPEIIDEEVYTCRNWTTRHDDLVARANALGIECALSPTPMEHSDIPELFKPLPHDYAGKPVNACQGRDFVPFDGRGYTVVEVMPFLIGKKWDGVALGYVHGLRPSRIRVVRHGEGLQCDARTWRVTVQLRQDGETIERIHQEIEVGLPDGIKHGAALNDALVFGIESEQVKWHVDSKMTCYDFTGLGGYEKYKINSAGEAVPFPSAPPTAPANPAEPPSDSHP